VVYLLAKVEVSSSNSSRDMAGYQNSKSRSRDPFPTWYCTTRICRSLVKPTHMYWHQCMQWTSAL